METVGGCDCDLEELVIGMVEGSTYAEGIRCTWVHKLRGFMPLHCHALG